LQTFIFIYIIVNGQGGQSLNNRGSLLPVIGHPSSGLGVQYVY